METSSYNLIRSDHSSNNKRRGIFMYSKHFLLLRSLDIQYLQECINFDMRIGDKVCNFIFLYISPIQTLDDFETFIKNFELNLENIVYNNPFLFLANGDFNVKWSKWWSKLVKMQLLPWEIGFWNRNTLWNDTFSSSELRTTISRVLSYFVENCLVAS